MSDYKPFISVVIPTINEEKYLRRPLESLSKQTYKNFEIIVADGNSVDNTVKIARQYGAKTIICPNSTVTIARQKGAELAKGEIIVGADADTSYPPDHLARIISDFEKDKNIVAVGGGGIFESKPWWVFWFWKIMYAIYGRIYKLFKIAVYIPAFNLSYKKDVFKKIGGYNTYLDFGGDELDILARLKKTGKVYFDTELICYPSSRRAKEGFWKLIIKHTLIDYYLAYILSSIFHRTIIKGKAVR